MKMRELDEEERHLLRAPRSMARSRPAI